MPIRHAAFALLALLPLPAITATTAVAAPAPATLPTDAPKDFLPEGVAWDAAHRRFFLSSIRLHRVDAIDPHSGHAKVFADAPGSVLGLQISADGKTLWAAWTRFAGNFRHNLGTGLIAWSLQDGRRIGSWPIDDRDPRANLGDLLLVDADTAITTDSGTGAVYRFDLRDHRYRRLIAPDQFASPQGIARGHQPGTVYIADYPTGLWQMKVADGSRQLLPAPNGSDLRGLDGLYRAGDGLVAVQNGSRTPRILWIALDSGGAITRVDKLAEGRPEWDEPSLGAVVGSRFWFNAVSQWGRFDGELKMLPGAVLRSPVLDSVALPGEHSR